MEEEEKLMEDEKMEEEMNDEGRNEEEEPMVERIMMNSEIIGVVQSVKRYSLFILRLMNLSKIIQKMFAILLLLFLIIQFDIVNG